MYFFVKKDIPFATYKNIIILDILYRKIFEI